MDEKGSFLRLALDNDKNQAIETKHTDGKRSAQSANKFGSLAITPKKKDTTLGCRYEIKYLIPVSKANAVERYVADYVPIDHYSKLQPDGFYPICSLYMDSPELRLCKESLTGVLNRFKLRIRSYSDDPEYPRFFEIKRRANTVIMKSRAKVKFEDVKRLITEPTYFPKNMNSAKDIEGLKMYMLYQNSINARPVVLIRYLRKAYEGVSENRVRVTFDKDLAFNVTTNPAVVLGGPGWQRNNVSLQGIVLEIKFTGRFPAWLSRMAELFSLKQQSVSKYSTSVENACMLRFCAPTIPQNYMRKV